MYEPTRIFRSLLLCSVIYTIANSIQIANALDTTYEIGGVTRTSEFIPNPAGANGSKAVYTPNSASKMPNGTRIPYGLRGTLRTGSRLFKWLLAAEAGIEVLDWIKSQYNLPAGFEVNENLEATRAVSSKNYLCDVTECYWKAYGDAETKYATFGAAAEAGIANWYKTNPANCRSNDCYINSVAIGTDKNGVFKINYRIPSSGVSYQATSQLIPFYGDSAKTLTISDYWYLSTFPLTEPTIAPNPWKSGEIIEAYAGKVGGWGDFVSQNVEILDQPIRWTELPTPAGMPKVDTVTDLIRVPGYEPKPPALIPDPEPLRPDPDGLKKIPNPLIQGLPDPTTPQPPPAVRTQDLIGGGMTVTNTYNIQNTSTAINLNIENKEITYAGNEEEIKPPADLTETETLEARQRLLIPTTDENFMNSYVQNILSKVPIPQVELLSDNSASCPPPRRLALFGTAEIELSYEGICQFLPMIKAMMIGFIGFALFGVWIKRISSS